ncbi:hypothetical protein GYMLUDRAFT_252429 [Collybiopsis luxurians FD-317 M1]|uniref:Uncharacterized protein n=1 Tax=Collybiopsis luxurians FD-317 M1 TaxID=944289 RepID=A0A0D0C0E7_9AGAR|nr:hypothetical protein GYMLUDRAFT_252429 [Collybiopsis luxurians FD-317 M1]
MFLPSLPIERTNQEIGNAIPCTRLPRVHRYALPLPCLACNHPLGLLFTAEHLYLYDWRSQYQCHDQVGFDDRDHRRDLQSECCLNLWSRRRAMRSSLTVSLNAFLFSYVFLHPNDHRNHPEFSRPLRHLSSTSESVSSSSRYRHIAIVKVDQIRPPLVDIP